MKAKIISEEEFAVDPQMMFQRMLMIVNNSDSKIKKNRPLNTATKAKFSGAIAKIYKDNPGNTIPGWVIATVNTMDKRRDIQSLKISIYV